jgi:hypothetical protein
VTEVLVIAENETARRTPQNPRARVTLEVYSFNKEQHKLWEVPCIQPLETEGSIVVAAKVSLNCRAQYVLTLV